MKLDSTLSIYVTCTYKSRRLFWVGKLADVLQYVTVVPAIGLSKEWGEEPTEILFHSFDKEHTWSWYDDLKPLLEQYMQVEEQDAIAIGLHNGHGYALHIITRENSNWFDLETQLFIPTL